MPNELHHLQNYFRCITFSEIKFDIHDHLFSCGCFSRQASFSQQEKKKAKKKKKAIKAFDNCPRKNTGFSQQF